MNWADTNTIQLDGTMLFGKGYDFSGLESHRQEAFTDGIGYAIWPESGGWAIYETSEGGFARVADEAAAKATAEEWAASR